MSELKDLSVSFQEKVDIGNLRYKNIADISLIDQRKTIVLPAQNSSYTQGETMRFRFSVGSAMVHGRKSYIRLSVTTSAVNATDALSFGGAGASVTNLLDSSILKRGKEIERIDELGRLIYIKDQWGNDYHDLYSHGSMETQGYRVGATMDLVTKTTFMIPLSSIGGFFDTEQLLPHQVLGGAELQLKLVGSENTTFVFAGAADSDTTFTVTDAELVLDTYHPVPALAQWLQKEASSTVGLVHTFKSYHHNVINMGNNASLSENIGKPVSHATRAWVQPVQNVTGGAQITDVLERRRNSFGSKYIKDDLVTVADNATWFFRLGSQQLPECAVDTAEEAFVEAVKCFQLKGKKPQVSISEFKGTNDAGIATSEVNARNLGVFAADLNRDGLHDMTGQSLSVGSTQLRFDLKYDVAPSGTAGATLHCYMEYMKNVSGYSSGNSTVRE